MLFQKNSLKQLLLISPGICALTLILVLCYVTAPVSVPLDQNGEKFKLDTIARQSIDFFPYFRLNYLIFKDIQGKQVSVRWNIDFGHFIEFDCPIHGIPLIADKHTGSTDTGSLYEVYCKSGNRKFHVLLTNNWKNFRVVVKRVKNWPEEEDLK